MVRERQTARKSTGASKKQLAAQAAAARRRRKKEERLIPATSTDAPPARTTGMVICEVEAQPQPQSSRPELPIAAQNTSVLDDAELARRAVSSLLNAQDRARTAEIWDREGPSAGYKAGAQALAYFDEAASRAQKTWEENVALKKVVESLRVAKGAAEKDLEKQRIYWIALDKERHEENAALKKEIESLLAAKGAVEEDFEKQKTYWVALEDANSAMALKLDEAKLNYSDLAQKRRKAEERRIALEKELAAEKKLSGTHKATMAELNRQLTALNADLSASRADCAAAKEDLHKLKEEQAAFLSKYQELLAQKDALLVEKEELITSLANSQAAVVLLKDEVFKLQHTIVELSLQIKENELTISSLKCSHLQFLRAWVNSSAYEDAFAYSSQTDYIMGYSDARRAIFEVLRKLGLAEQLSPGQFRSFPNERMLEDGCTLRLPVEKRPPINLEDTPEKDLQYPEWEAPYISPHPMEGELMDLPLSVYADLANEF